MNRSPAPGIILFVEFAWPRPFVPDHGTLASQLHAAVAKHAWLREIVAASGGVGGRPSSPRGFLLPGYAARAPPFRLAEGPGGQAHPALFSGIDNGSANPREGVLFS